MVIKAPKKRLFPYLNEMKSAMEDILCCFEIRMILRNKTIQIGTAIAGPRFSSDTYTTIICPCRTIDRQGQGIDIRIVDPFALCIFFSDKGNVKKHGQVAHNDNDQDVITHNISLI